MRNGFLCLLMVLAGCKSGPQITKTEMARVPSSAEPTECLERALASPDDPNYIAALKTYESSGRFEAKIESRLKALIQAYVLGEVLKRDFDRLVNLGFSLDRIIHQSDTYSKLLALRSIKEKIEKSLKGLYQVRIHHASTTTGESASEVTKKAIAEIVGKIEALAVQASQESILVRLALLEFRSDIQDVEEEVLHCESKEDPAHEARQLQLEKDREALIVELGQKAVIQPGAYKQWEPAENEKGEPSERGYKIYDLVKHEAKKIKRDLQEIEDRAPSSEGAMYAPDVGTKGNMVGSKFPEGTWALTYDDGPAKTTGQVLANLEKHQMKATFFILSQQILPGKFGDSAKKELQSHAVASHSYTHANVPKLSAAGRKHEIVDAIAKYQEVLGEKPLFFRLPYGSGVSVPSIREMIKDAGMIHVFWNVDTLDWQDKNPDTIAQRAIKQIQTQGRGIILFHDIHPQSVTASEKIMAYLKDPKNGLRTVTIPEIVKEQNGP